MILAVVLALFISSHVSYGASPVPWKWTGTFHVGDDASSSWVFDRNHDMLGDMKILVLQATSMNADDLKSLHSTARHLFDSDSVQIGDELLLGRVHRVQASEGSWISILKFALPPSAGHYAVYFSKNPNDFCHAADDCFKSSEGVQIEVSAFSALYDTLADDEEHHDDEEDHHEEDSPTKWGQTLQACTVVWCAVFAGVVLLGGGCKKYESIDATAVTVEYLNMFAAGALLGTAFCLVLIEASHLIATEYGEAATSGYWGCMILAGFLSCGCIEICRHYVKALVPCCLTKPPKESVVAIGTENPETEMAAVGNGSYNLANTEGGNDEEATREKEVTSKDDSLALGEGDYSIISTIFIGDFFHNFSDGIFIGAAFQMCSATVAWTIVLSTVFHEFAQEIADFIVLTKKAKLPVMHALIVNAISGLSVIVGGIVIGAQDMKDSTVGMLLAFGAGNYIYIAAAELYPTFHEFPKHSHKLMGLMLFALGAAAVGLVLLDHEHCEADDAHSDH